MREPEPVLDPVTLAALHELGDDDVLTELVTMFIDDVHSQVAALRDAAASHDRVVMKRAAHGLAGSSASLAARPLSELCRRLETVATSEASSMDSLVDEVDAAAARTEAALRAEFLCH